MPMPRERKNRSQDEWGCYKATFKFRRAAAVQEYYEHVRLFHTLGPDGKVIPHTRRQSKKLEKLAEVINERDC